MARDFTVTVRNGPKVVRSRHSTLVEALDALAASYGDLEGVAHRDAVDLHVRRFEPVAQVAARLEVAGPGRLRPRVRAGIDVRGDGSAEAWTGGASKRMVEQRKRESPLDALRRELS